MFSRWMGFFEVDFENGIWERVGNARLINEWSVHDLRALHHELRIVEVVR